MSKNILDSLFTSPTRVKVLKVFLRNPEPPLLLKDIARIAKQSSRAVEQEINKLKKIDFIRERKLRLPGKKVSRKFLTINPSFPISKELEALLLKPELLSYDDLRKKISALGQIKLVILSGAFINKTGSKTDLLIVGDRINQRKLNSFVKLVGAELGKELDFVVMAVEDFYYRKDMTDRFIKEILEGDNVKLIDRLSGK